MGEFYYENDTLRFIHHEEGRIVVDVVNSELDYQYHLRDHLGNTRLTFSTTPENYTRTETFESGEDNGFADLHRHTNANANTTVGGNEVELLQSNQTGAMAMIRVDKGDTVKLSVQANYESAPSGNTFAETAFALLFNAFDGAYGASSGEGGISGGSASEFDDALNGSGMTSKSDASSAPRAFLNYIYFDNDMQHHTAGFEQVTTGAMGIGVHESVIMDEIIADKGGYIMVYLSNENSQAVNMHFDDLTIYHGKTNVVQADDYYPFGLAFNSFTRSYSSPQNFKFNGGSELNEITGNYETFYRNYDPVLGRFNSVDIKSELYASQTPYQFAGNNPIFFNDPLGDQYSSDREEWNNQDLSFMRGGSNISSMGVAEEYAAYMSGLNALARNTLENGGLIEGAISLPTGDGWSYSSFKMNENETYTLSANTSYTDPDPTINADPLRKTEIDISVDYHFDSSGNLVNENGEVTGLATYNVTNTTTITTAEEVPKNVTTINRYSFKTSTLTAPLARVVRGSLRSGDGVPFVTDGQWTLRRESQSQKKFRVSVAPNASGLRDGSTSYKVSMNIWAMRTYNHVESLLGQTGLAEHHFTLKGWSKYQNEIRD
ncbi:MAG: hypothetical protein GY820_12420 [Gammaproteobacteria bacterium]|nr:hypothetical protein [Gammaproteobacteria bacterium]